MTIIKDDENSDDKDDANDTQATSEECEDSYLEVARPRRSHHHWENRLDNILTKKGLKILIINDCQDFSSSPTKLRNFLLKKIDWEKYPRSDVFFMKSKFSQVGFPLCHACIQLQLECALEVTTALLRSVI